MALFELNTDKVNLEMHKAKSIPKEHRHIVVHFESGRDLAAFSKLIGMPLLKKDKKVFYDLNAPRSENLVNIENAAEVEYDMSTQHWEYWWGMPEYISFDKQGYHFVYVYFKDEESKKHFIELVNQKITDTTKYIWYPEREKLSRLAYKWVIDT
jgi:hypothetical protein